MSYLKLGVVKTSLLENENRLPIYPAHLGWIDKELRSYMSFEFGYGDEYGVTDSDILDLGYNLATRKEVVSQNNVVLLPKPQLQDLYDMKNGATLWGWPHCVQQFDIAEAAIQNKLTLIAWEAMNHWSKFDEKLMHIFYKNNEIAGYAAVLHALQLRGIDGFYGPRRKVIVLSYGSVSKGAIFALHARGFNNISVFTKRPPHLVLDKNPDVYFYRMLEDNGVVYSLSEDGTKRKLIEEFSEANIIVNGILQDTDNPTMFMSEKEISMLKNDSIIIDVSCDKGLGFPFARPTSFKAPMFKVNDSVYYYSVDHTPTYLWNSASREISKALLPYLKCVMEGCDSWKTNKTISKAIEIEQGFVKNNKIINYQHRKDSYTFKQI